MVGRFERRYVRVGYGRPRDIKGAGKVINAGSLIGARVLQIVYVRPGYFGYRVAGGRAGSRLPK